MLELVSSVKNIFTREGNWFWTNVSGTQLRWANLPVKTIFNNIENALSTYRNVNLGKFFEAEVAKQMIYLTKKFGDEITDFANLVRKLPSKIRNGDIDLATKKYIFEAKLSLRSNSKIEELYNQIQKYLPENALSNDQFMNPMSKKVVVVYESLGNFNLNHPLLKELQNKGVIFIKGVSNLKKLY
jgi:hypothetical protein